MGIPEGWLDYTKFGQPIRNTRIIPIKTPLKTKFNSGLRKRDSPPYESGIKYGGGVPLEEEFTPLQLLDQVDRILGKKLQAVIDLTFTFRYYNSMELVRNGVKYAKIKCPGREIPNEEIYSEFRKVLSEFLEECGGDSLVAVHCTHGLNRTGYLVCRYLMETKGVDANTAIKDFNEARGHNIERENYLQHLKDRYRDISTIREAFARVPCASESSPREASGSSYRRIHWTPDESPLVNPSLEPWCYPCHDSGGSAECHPSGFHHRQTPYQRHEEGRSTFHSVHPDRGYHGRHHGEYRGGYHRYRPYDDRNYYKMRNCQ